MKSPHLYICLSNENWNGCREYIRKRVGIHFETVKNHRYMNVLLFAIQKNAPDDIIEALTFVYRDAFFSGYTSSPFKNAWEMKNERIMQTLARSGIFQLGITDFTDLLKQDTSLIRFLSVFSIDEVSSIFSTVCETEFRDSWSIVRLYNEYPRMIRAFMKYGIDLLDPICFRNNVSLALYPAYKEHLCVFPTTKYDYLGRVFKDYLVMKQLVVLISGQKGTKCPPSLCRIPKELWMLVQVALTK